MQQTDFHCTFSMSYRLLHSRVKSRLCFGPQRAHNLSRELAFIEGLLCVRHLWDAFLHLFALLKILTTYVREAGSRRWVPMVYFKGNSLDPPTPTVPRKFLVAPATGVESDCRSRAQNSHFRDEDTEPQWDWETHGTTLLQKLYTADPRSVIV